MIGLLVVAFFVVMFFVSLGLKRHGESAMPAGDWQRTDEVFIDPTTERRMRVWIDPYDGTRHYVPESS